MRVNSVRFKKVEERRSVGKVVSIVTGEGENEMGELRSRVCVYHRICRYLPLPCEQNKMVAVSLYGSEINLSVVRERDIFEQKNVHVLCIRHGAATHRGISGVVALL